MIKTVLMIFISLVWQYRIDSYMCFKDTKWWLNVSVCWKPAKLRRGHQDWEPACLRQRREGRIIWMTAFRNIRGTAKDKVSKEMNNFGLLHAYKFYVAHAQCIFTHPVKVNNAETSLLATCNKTLPFLTARNSFIASSCESPWRVVPLIAKISSPAKQSVGQGFYLMNVVHHTYSKKALEIMNYTSGPKRQNPSPF